MFKLLMLTIALSFGLSTVAHIELYKNLIISFVVAIIIIASTKGGKGL